MEMESMSKATDDDDDEEDENIPITNSKNLLIRTIEHYSSSHRILLVGEGDFSFSLCIANAFGSAKNIVATSIDSQKDLVKKYSKGIRNVRELEEMGGVVLCGVDAEKMSQHFFLRTQRFDRIIYNFPHVGFHYPENNGCQIKLNKRLVKGFLKNAKVLLIKRRNVEGGGEIHVTHKDGDPYNRWDLVKKANKIGLILHESVPFRKDNYPGYDNKRAHGYFSDAPFPLGDCTTFKFTNVEQLKRETEANRKKNESLEKRSVGLEKDMREFKAAITSKKEPLSNMENKVAALEKQVAELKSTISKLKSTSSQPVTPGPSESGSETTQLKKKVEELELRLMTVEVDNWTKDKAIETQKTVELEKQLVELTPIRQIETTTSAESNSLVSSMEQEFANPSHDSTNDLVGCLIVLIFLVTVLIGLNM